MNYDSRVLIAIQNNISVYIELLNSDQADVVAVDQNGNESRVNFDESFKYRCGNHKFSMKYRDFCNLVLKNNQSLSVQEICKRADLYKKTIYGYYGKNSKLEQVWGVQCLICGYKAKKFARHFDCCSGCFTLDKVTSNEKFLKKAVTVHDGKYTYPDPYKGTNIKMRIFCPDCNEYFEQTPRSHLSGSGCAKCNISKGELKIKKHLNMLCEKFIWHHVFEGLVHKSNLEVDFYLPERKIIIEYDGEGHYLESFYYGRSKNPKQSLLECQLRDEIKNTWAKENGYILIRIPYWDFHKIEEIVNFHLGVKYAEN